MTLSNWGLYLLDMLLQLHRAIHTANGPLRATLFLSMLSMVSGAMTVLPSISLGVTSTGSHLIGACRSISISQPCDPMVLSVP